MKYKIYLSGEIHSDWRNKIKEGLKDTPVEIYSPVTDHNASDNVGIDILGKEENSFWKDHKSAKINAIRTGKGIDECDILVVKFGEKYRQWNAAFDAGYAAAKNKSIIAIQPTDLTHALKEINASAAATVQTEEQVIEIIKYIVEKD